MIWNRNRNSQIIREVITQLEGLKEGTTLIQGRLKVLLERMEKEEKKKNPAK